LKNWKNELPRETQMGSSVTKVNRAIKVTDYEGMKVIPAIRVATRLTVSPGAAPVRNPI